MEVIQKKRDYGFDNLKLFLIILVVFGHIIEEISLTGSLGVIRSVIYSFHMPLFVFISGYFSKYSSNKYSKSLSNYLIPFFVFNTAFSVLIYHSFKINVFLPNYAFWYLLSLFMWNICIESLSKLKLLLALSILLGLYCGLFEDIDRLFSLSRTICFFPFFVLGYYFSSEKIEKLRSYNKAVPIIGIVVSLTATAVLNYKGVIPVKMYEMIQSYSTTGVGHMNGLLQRAAIYCFAFVLIICFVMIVPNREYFFTKYGTRTICVYIFSSFLIKLMFKGITHMNLEWIYMNELVEIAYATVAGTIIMLLTANNFVFKGYSVFQKIINKVFIKP